MIARSTLQGKNNVSLLPMFFHPQLIQLDYFTGARQQGLLYFLRHLHKLKTTTLCIKQNPDYFSGVISEVHRTTERTSPEELG